ncbi:hypothetical protein [Neorhizobium alkalisoli]|uniref:hypothetical protein n=1 Tax=Neorhizobium alkalisoli TaxID=528178 RepID=UPI0011A14557|nr:hypothetical protein [Neorhizobium alkalisoli]
MVDFTAQVAEETAINLSQIAEIEAGLAEADRCEFASEEELATVIAKYVKAERRQQPPST